MTVFRFVSCQCSSSFKSVRDATWCRSYSYPKKRHLIKVLASEPLSLTKWKIVGFIFLFLLIRHFIFNSTGGSLFGTDFSLNALFKYINRPILSRSQHYYKKYFWIAWWRTDHLITCNWWQFPDAVPFQLGVIVAVPWGLNRCKWENRPHKKHFSLHLK